MFRILTTSVLLALLFACGQPAQPTADTPTAAAAEETASAVPAASNSLKLDFMRYLPPFGCNMLTTGTCTVVRVCFLSQSGTSSDPGFD